jgi:hypothetical protein
MTLAAAIWRDGTIRASAAVVRSGSRYPVNWLAAS